jgi:hypothetical protein
LIFKPLVNEFPAFGAVLFSLREKVSYIVLEIMLILGENEEYFKISLSTNR